MNACLRVCSALIFGLLLGLPVSLRAAPEKSDKTRYFENLPANNPYRDLLLLVDGVPAEDRAAIDAWLSAKRDTSADAPSPALSAEHRAIAENIVAALVTASARAKSTTPDPEQWPPYYPDGNDQNPYAALVPGVGQVRQLALLATQLADERPPGEALDLYLAAAQLGRHQRGGVTLIEQLTGVAVEGIALAGPTRRLREFSPAELARLATAWAALPAPPDVPTALSGVREAYAKMMKNIFVPALIKALAEEDAAAAADTDFTRDLRLSGLINLGGDDIRISLENTLTGATFTLTPTQAAEGMELVKVDFDQRLAHIRRGDAEAVIHLESRRLELVRPVPPSLQKLVGSLGDTTDASRRMLDRLRHHPEGAEGYTRDVVAEYNNYLDQMIARTFLADDSAPSPAPPAPSMVAMVTPTVDKVGRTLQSSATQAVMLQAAIAHRLGELGAAQTSPTDPWADDDSPFTFSPTDDGGFTLSSVYQVRENQPIVYKFAAPDAGFQRVTVKPAKPVSGNPP